MKHNIKITIILLSMFIITQFIGLLILNLDPYHIKTEVNGEIELQENKWLSWINPPAIEEPSDFSIYFSSMLVSFIIAVVILFILTKYKIDTFMKIWFFSVITIALFISLNAFFPKSIFFEIPLLVLALTLSFFKLFRRNIFVHNITELFIYPGLATVFVPILNIWSVSILLVLISVYDMWAVWHSGIMQKMAKYQMNNLKVFSGFFIPYISKKMKKQIKNIKKSKLKTKKISTEVAILGGGDVVFPIITAGVIFRFRGFLPALFIIIGATLGLGLLFLFSEKKKFYPAMPFISTGIFLGMILGFILF